MSMRDQKSGIICGIKEYYFIIIILNWQFNDIV